MKNLLTLSLLATLLMSSCSSISSARQDIQDMSPVQYEELQTKIVSITEIASSRISQGWSEEYKLKALLVVDNITDLLNDKSKLKELNATDLIRTLGNRYSDQLGLNSQAKSSILDALLLIDVMVGPIKIDTNGNVNERELGVLLAILQGLGNGLTR